MMKNRKFRNVCLIMACVLLCCGCGEKSAGILIGETAGLEEEAPIGEPGSGRNADAPGEPGSAGTAKSSEESGKSGDFGGTGPEEQTATIRVYVCGAVANPGVVEIPQGSRVEDALEAAGGFGAEAGREAVNLADWVSDGQKLYFPREGEAAEESTAQSQAAPGLVNINTADMETLCTLPGIGESRARDIISYREANGGFEACEDIMKVPGIKTAAYGKICDKITVK